jgi:hypothetical protein
MEGCEECEFEDPFKLIRRFSLFAKISACAVGQWFLVARPALDQGGPFAIVTNVRCGMRWTRAAQLTSAPDADGEVVAS